MAPLESVIPLVTGHVLFPPQGSPVVYEEPRQGVYCLYNNPFSHGQR